ncbi:hypothetical protein [Photorhabdus khanii]|uniref:Hemolysin XhlA n=1 Tax=Photorhabdus khanii subsp. guanajuatensis TaxID=2100166 RepID=A0A4R4K6Y6_9GAMM|nr:hypothetical protein [Photorhabdus khanii]TDB63258.1 hypothetical protein C5467_01615 [Photorhabdus khanii subsp. guanajuatensis]
MSDINDKKIAFIKSDIDRRLESINQQLESIEKRFDRLEDKSDRLHWLIIVAAMLALFFNKIA